MSSFPAGTVRGSLFAGFVYALIVVPVLYVLLVWRILTAFGYYLTLIAGFFGTDITPVLKAWEYVLTFVPIIGRI